MLGMLGGQASELERSVIFCEQPYAPSTMLLYPAGSVQHLGHLDVPTTAV